MLGGYGFSDVSLVEKQTGLAAVPEGDLDTNFPRVMTWLVSVLLPCVSLVWVLYQVACSDLSLIGLQPPILCLDSPHRYRSHPRFHFDDPRHNPPLSIFGTEHPLPLVTPRSLWPFRVDCSTYA